LDHDLLINLVRSRIYLEASSPRPQGHLYLGRIHVKELDVHPETTIVEVLLELGKSSHPEAHLEVEA
jgi:hypothetical protein